MVGQQLEAIEFANGVLVIVEDGNLHGVYVLRRTMWVRNGVISWLSQHVTQAMLERVDALQITTP